MCFKFSLFFVKTENSPWGSTCEPGFQEISGLRKNIREGLFDCSMYWVLCIYLFNNHDHVTSQKFAGNLFFLDIRVCILDENIPKDHFGLTSRTRGGRV